MLKFSFYLYDNNVNPKSSNIINILVNYLHNVHKINLYMEKTKSSKHTKVLLKAPFHYKVSKQILVKLVNNYIITILIDREKPFNTTKLLLSNYNLIDIFPNIKIKMRFKLNIDVKDICKLL